MSEQQLEVQNNGERIAVVLKVNHLEAISSGFEEGPLFSPTYYNDLIHPNIDDMIKWVNSLKLIQGLVPGYDYAVGKVIPENLDVLVGPGDYLVVYEDGHFGCYVGIGSLDVVGGKVIVGR